MERRSLLQAGVAAAAATTGLSAPALSQRANARTLRFVPQANLANFDPIWGTQYVVRNAAALVWDTLYGINEKLEPKRQMIDSEETSSDGLTWTFRLRPGLKWHDGEPVRARDCVASLTRWCARDPMGQMLKDIQQELVAVNDTTFRWVLKRPYPKLLIALGKANTPLCCMMPERIAATDPFTQISEYIGSGPMRLVRNEWIPGAKAVFAKFEDYVPRSEPADWLSGGKRMNFDRIEWLVMPDPATASAALQNGEVDWWETPLVDLVPQLRRNRNIAVDIADPLGNVGSFRMNHLYPPFDNVGVRRAVQVALSQEDYMRAVVGDDTDLWKLMPSFFTPGTPLYTEAGGEPLKGPRNIDLAKRMLAQAGYNGTPVVLLVAQDQPVLKAMGDMTNALLTSIGMRVDYVATDWGTVGTRRASKEPPSRGGWNIFHTWHAGADCTNPASYSAMRTNGANAWWGWPDNAEIEALRDRWFDAGPAEEQAIVDEYNKKSMEFATWIPNGFYLGYQAWRRNVSGIVKAPLPIFWGVSKS
ncbi:MAG: transporter substrate-binding protein [Rubritepida sp.]|nr:transporter substrate-binding protein [Rubritepida sp.]